MMKERKNTHSDATSQHNTITMKKGHTAVSMEMYSLLVPVDPETVILLVTAKGWYCNICNLSCGFSAHNSMEGHMRHFHEISTTGINGPEEGQRESSEDVSVQVRDLGNFMSTSFQECSHVYGKHDVSMQILDPTIGMTKALSDRQCWNNESKMSSQVIESVDAETFTQESHNAEAAVFQTSSTAEEDGHKDSSYATGKGDGDTEDCSHVSCEQDMLFEDSNFSSCEQDRHADNFYHLTGQGDKDTEHTAEQSVLEVAQKQECASSLKEKTTVSKRGKHRKQSRKGSKSAGLKKARRDNHNGQNVRISAMFQPSVAADVWTESVVEDAEAEKPSDVSVLDKPHSGQPQTATRNEAKGERLTPRSSLRSKSLRQCKSKLDKKWKVGCKGKVSRLSKISRENQEVTKHSSTPLTASAVCDLFDQYVDRLVDRASALNTVQALASHTNSDTGVTDTSESRTHTRSQASQDITSQTSEIDISLKVLNLKKERPETKMMKGYTEKEKTERISVGDESDQRTAGAMMEGVHEREAEDATETALYDTTDLHFCQNKTVMYWPESDTVCTLKSGAPVTESTLEKCCYGVDVQHSDTSMVGFKPIHGPLVIEALSTELSGSSLLIPTIHSLEESLDTGTDPSAGPLGLRVSVDTETSNNCAIRKFTTEINKQTTENICKEENAGYCVCKERREADCTVCKEGRKGDCSFCQEGRKAGCSVCKKGREDRSSESDACNSGRAVKAEQCVCDFCNHSFENLNALQSHLSHYAGQVPVRCKVCQYTFHNLDLLNVHIFFIHEKSESVKPTCFTCNKPIHRRSLPEHIARVHKTSQGLQAFQVRQDSKTVTECPVCHVKLLNDHRMVEAHARTHTKKDGKSHCQSCGLSFRTSFLLHAHLYAAHNSDKTGRQFQTEMSAEVKRQMTLLIQKEQSRDPGPESVWCGICHQDIHDSAHKMLNHLMSHCPRWKLQDSERLFSCPDCGRDIPAASATYHRLTHGHLDSETTKLRCSQCGAAFTSEGNRSRHELLMHQIDHGTSKQDKRSICEICGKKFVTKQLLRRHVKRHEEETGHFNCEICSKGFELRSAMEAHRQRHDAQGKSTPCPHCAKKYMSKKALERHIQVEHLHVKDYRFKCDRCTAQYMDSTQLRDHIATKHEGRQPYSCTICFRGFVCRPTLKRHMRRDHREAPNPYVCKVCGERFYEKRYLARHEVTHTGVDPWVCHFCNKSFSCQSTFRSHMDCHKGIRPYLCDHCGMRFLAHKHLERHKERSCAGNKLGPNRYKVKVIEELVGVAS